MLPDSLPEPHPYRSLFDLTPETDPGATQSAAGSVDWLWPGWIPRGMLTLLAAAPGTGKSLVALDLARRVIAGLPFPDGAPGASFGSNVLLVDAEGPLSLLDRRARAWNIDRSRLFLMQPSAGDLFDLASSAQLKLLARMIRHLEPALLIIDSLGAALPGGEAVATSLHRLLATLPRLAAHANLALLLIHHLRKRSYTARRGPAVTVDDLRGSSHIVAVARSILALSPISPSPRAGRLPSPQGDRRTVPAAGRQGSGVRAGAGGEGARRLEVIKSNLGPLPPPLGLLLEPGNEGAPILRYTGPIVEPEPPPSQLELCAAWLLDHLAAAGEPLRPADLLLAAAASGFSQATLYRARRALGDSVLDLGRSAHDPARRWTLAHPTPKTWTD